MKYIPRILQKKLSEYLSIFPVVGITGPRQSGKSTMLKKTLKNKYRYVTFDDYKTINFLHEDPDQFIKTYGNKVIFDEVQKVPDLFPIIKIAVDNDRQNYGKFILTGSSQFAFLKNISESLAGRMGLLSLLPFQFKEVPFLQQNKSLYKGSYPELIIRNYKFSEEWYSAYLETYLEKDIKSLYNIGDLRDFRLFLTLLASKISKILNMSKISKDLGIAVSTIKKWISTLEASYVVFLLPAYYKNFGKRVTKNPKLYFYDTGLVAYLTGLKNKEHFEKGPLYGNLFENYIISEIQKNNMHKKLDKNLFYFRESNGDEIDLIEERKTITRTLIEIKSGHTFKPLMAQTLKKYKTEKDIAYVLYAGENAPYKKDIKILNYKKYLT